MKNWKAILAVALVAVGIGVYVGHLLSKPTIETLTERNNQLAERAKVTRIAYQDSLGDLAEAYQKLTFDYTSEYELRQELERRNSGLAEELSEAEGTITRLAQANTELRETLEGMDPVAETDSSFIVEIDKRKVYDRGEISVQGEVAIDKARPDSASTRLEVGVKTSPLVVWQRMGDGTSRLTIDYGDMPVTVDSIYGASNVNDPIHDQTRQPLFGGFKGVATGALVGALLTSIFLNVF